MKKYLKLFLLVGLIWNMGVMTSYGAGLSLESIDNVGASGLYTSKDNILYITDGYNNQIYKYNGATVTLLAGNKNLIKGIPSPGYHDGIAKYTLFHNPYMAIPWRNGVLVSDTDNHALRYIVDDTVETYAGGELGYKDGLATEALFDRPTGLAIDDAENIYIADTGNGVIRKMDKNGFIITYAEGFQGPMGLFWFDDTLYVTDVVTNQIFTIQNGQTTLLAGKAIQDGEEWISGYQDGAIEDATFSLPQGIYVDEIGIYIGDTGNNAVRQITDGQVTTCEIDENLADPIGITKYDGQLYTGDPFSRMTYKTATEIYNPDTKMQDLDTDVDVDLEKLEIQDPSNLSQETTAEPFPWLWTSLVVLVGCGVVLGIFLNFIKGKKSKEKEQ